MQEPELIAAAVRNAIEQLLTPSALDTIAELIARSITSELARPSPTEPIPLAVAAVSLGVSRSRLYRLIAEGTIATVLEGRRRYVMRAELERYLTERASRADPL